MFTVADCAFYMAVLGMIGRQALEAAAHVLGDPALRRGQQQGSCRVYRQYRAQPFPHFGLAQNLLEPHHHRHLAHGQDVYVQ